MSAEVIGMTRTIDHWESKPCTRCGGSGTYSLCDTWGTTCFKCGTRPHEPGSGWQLTPLGAKARQAWLDANTDEVAPDALVVGDVVEYDGRRRVVLAVDHGDFGHLSGGTGEDRWEATFDIRVTLGGGRTVVLASTLPWCRMKRWTERIPLPPEMEPGTDRRAEMKAVLNAAKR